MRKTMAMFLVLAILVCLFSCGEKKSESVKAAENAITAIGEVTIDSKEAIVNAERYYNMLTEIEKTKVSNRLDLFEAREAFDELFKKSMYESSGNAYTKITEAAQLCIDGMDDIYNVWRFGIYETDDSSTYMIFYDIASETSFTKEEIEAAANKLGVSAYSCVNGSAGTSAWNFCLWVVEEAHKERGTFEQLKALLKDAEILLKEVGDSYSDYEHYPSLKKYYSEVASYADFFENSSVSFEQLKTIITDYENEIRTLDSDLKFVFEDFIPSVEESDFEPNV